MKRKTLIYLTLLIVSTFILSCSKEAGDGGNSTISGKVFAKDYNATFTNLLGSYYESDQEVYIIYGDDITYSDKKVTSPDGIYEFKYLRSGKYTIYTYSKDSTLQTASDRIAVIQTVEITEKKQIVEVPDLVIFK